MRLVLQHLMLKKYQRMNVDLIHMKMQEFERPGQYEWNTVVQRCLVIANRACELLVTEFQWRPGKAIITAGKWDLHYGTLLEKKLPHITPVDTCGVGDFWILTRCESDESSGMLFLGRVLFAREVGIFEEEIDSQLRPRKLSWESPKSLYHSQELNPVQRSILLWMKNKFGWQ